MRRKSRIRRIARVLLAPVLLFLTAIISLYIPPVQEFVRREAVAYAGEATGMEINVRRIDLRFPFNLLARDVEVIQSADTLLSLMAINVRVKILPLFRKKVEVQGITLQEVSFNSSALIPGMQLQGKIGRFSLRGNKINLLNRTALFDRAELTNSRLRLDINDTGEAPRDTTSALPDWQLRLNTLRLKDVTFDVSVSADSIQLNTPVQNLTVNDIEVDLGKQLYSLRSLDLTASSVNYSGIALQEVQLELDSVVSHGKSIRAGIRKFSLKESSGFQITSMTGFLLADSSQITIPYFSLSTPYSQIDCNARVPRDHIGENPPEAFLDARIGKGDVMLLAAVAGLPDSLKRKYPAQSLVIQMQAEGNLNTVRVPRLSIHLPGAFSLTGSGELRHPESDTERSGTFHLQSTGYNLAFLSELVSGLSFVLPPKLSLSAKTTVNGPQYDTDIQIKDGEGTLNLQAGYNLTSEEYYADLQIDSLQVNHFLPKDSIRALTGSASLRGRGSDYTAPEAVAVLKASVHRLEYNRLVLSEINLLGKLKETILAARLTSNNPLLVMNAAGRYRVAAGYTDARVNVNVKQLDLYKMGIVPQPLTQPLAFTLEAEARLDSVNVSLTAGDLDVRLRADRTLEALIEQTTEFAYVLNRQIASKILDHKKLRRSLPSAGLIVRAGKDNPFNQFPAASNIRYDRFVAGYVSSPTRGINGRASIHALRIDTLRLDTVFVAVRQDTALLSIRGGVVNNVKNPHAVFKAFLTGEIRSNDAELLLESEDDKGKTNVLLGVNMRPYKTGVRFKFIPDEPIVAYRKFRFNEHNRIFVNDKLHVSANVEMLDKDGMGVRVHSLPDSVSRQNLDIEIRRIRLEELSSALPYLPQLSGLFSAEANYKQTADTKQLSVEAVVKELAYEKHRVGNMGLGITWLPDEKGSHYIDTYLACDGKQVLTATGMYLQGEEGGLSVAAVSDHFPLHTANVFIPQEMAMLSGAMDGELTVTGDLAAPHVNGKIILDSVTLSSKQYGVSFNFDNRPVEIKDNQLYFNDFAIYTTPQNPFIIKGSVNFNDISRPTADISMEAKNYTLLDARRGSGSLLYGKVFIDLKSTLKGPLDALVMRGNVDVRGNTDVTYVLTDSPLTVQDRLGGLVTFTSFADTLVSRSEDKKLVSLGGLDMLMNIRIDQTVRMKADLSADRSSRVELEGGGNLTFNYTPRGDMFLNGRYTLSGGIVKYTFPVIPLKEFNIKTGSYIEWAGSPTDPRLNFKATERIRASYTQEDGSSRPVNFDVSLEIKNKIENLELLFNLEAPEDIYIQNQLAVMSPEERSKQAVAMMVTGMYLAGGGAKNSGLDMGAALNSLLQNQIANIAGSALKKANISFGMENYDAAGGGKRTDYNFSYAQRFFNDRFQVVVGGRISTGDSSGQDETFIDNISLEYRLDASGTRNVHLYHNKNYENLLEGEVTETGVGFILRKKMNRLSEMFDSGKKQNTIKTE